MSRRRGAVPVGEAAAEPVRGAGRRLWTLQEVSTALTGRPLLLAVRLVGEAADGKRSEPVFVTDPDGAAAIVTEIEALMHRAGPEWLSAYGAAKYRRRAELRGEGADGGPGDG